MIQIWFLTLCYFLVTILILFLDDYRLTLGFMLTFRHRLIVDRRLRLAMASGGLVLAVLQLLFPMDPGPRVLGDLFGALLCIFIAIYYLRYADEDRKTYLRLSDRTCAVMLTVFTLAHFLFPFLVLI